ncbi:glycerol-3-phosphate responsive antiterminator [Arcanobacterium haemolyticum]|nr:glycerol-3-phosphate responsive antiterminator [Arcanobacterium haemolyticum]
MSKKKAIPSLELNRDIFASVHQLSKLDSALACEAKSLLFTNAHVGNLHALASRTHEAGKKVFVRAEMIGGLKADEAGLKMLVNAFHVDGIFTASRSVARIAQDYGLPVIWRLFLLDSRALEESLERLEEYSYSSFEMLPAPVALQHAHSILAAAGDTPVVTGGFVSHPQLTEQLFDAGFAAVTTSTPQVWQSFDATGHLKHKEHE